MKPNTVLASTTTYDLCLIQGATGLTYGVVNKTTGVVEHEDARLPFATKVMTELEELLNKWTPYVHEHNETGEEGWMSSLLEESNEKQ